MPMPRHSSADVKAAGNPQRKRILHSFALGQTVVVGQAGFLSVHSVQGQNVEVPRAAQRGLLALFKKLALLAPLVGMLVKQALRQLHLRGVLLEARESDVVAVLLACGAARQFLLLADVD